MTPTEPAAPRTFSALGLLFLAQTAVLLALPASAGGWAGALAVSAGLTALHAGLCAWASAGRRPYGNPDRGLLFEEVVVQSDDAVVIVAAEPGPDGGRPIVYVNAAFTRMTGYTPEDVVRRTLSVLRGPGTGDDQLEPMRAAFRAGRAGRSSVMNARKDGTPFWAEQVCFPVLGRAGRPGYWVFVLRDATAQVEAERAMARAKEAAEASNRAKDEFLANVSHELRTPLAAIVGYADMLRRPGLDDAGRDDAVASVRRNGRHLLQLIDDILDLSVIEAGRLTLRPAECSPAKLAAEAADAFRPQAAEKGLRLEVDAPAGLPGSVRTDPLRVRQVLLNFIGNAVKFTDAGRVAVRVACGPGPSLRFEVTDDGIGMTPEQLAGLYRPFRQGDGSPSRRHGGTGLGLSISKRLAEALGGEIAVTSAPGAGSTFTLTLPLPAECPPTPPAPPVTGPIALPPALRGRVLLAEDGRDNQVILTYQLRTAGLFVTLAENGREAVEKATAEPFDVVLMDMQMPELDGYGATRELRRRGYAGPVIALTAHAMAGDEEKCLAAGCTAYLAKPVDAERLLETVARHLPPPPDEPAREAPRPDTEELARDYRLRLEARLGELRAAVAADDRAAVRTLAHQTAGSAGMYGLPEVGETAKLLEQAAEEGQDGSLLADLVDEMGRLVLPEAGPGRH